MVADQPVPPSLLGELLERSGEQVEDLCTELATEYDVTGRGFVLVRVAGGYRFQSSPDLAAHVERFVLEGQTARLSAAALETLAIVAYKQPLSRGQIAAIRGVNVDGVMRTLVTRGLVEEAGTDAETGAVLYATSGYFLERMGLRDLDELPELAPFLPEMSDVDDVQEQEGPAFAETADAGVVDDGTADQLDAQR